MTLGEGGTPLLRAERLGAELGLSNLLIKDESRNPTGSFIDRGSTVLVSLARMSGVTECSCLTTGNLGASLSAYCAKAGIPARVTISPRTDKGKLYQMLAYGAEVVGPAHRHGVTEASASLTVNAANPYLLEGEKTTSFEIVQDLGWRAPDVIVVPVGTGGHLSMIWKGMAQLEETGLARTSRCRLQCVQLEGSVSMTGVEGRSRKASPEPAFTELEESEPFFRKEVERAIAESHGHGVMATEAATISATALLARTEGIFAEPASASVIAALPGAVDRGYVKRDDVVVCVITGSGLKDTKAISRLAKAARKVSVRDDLDAGRLTIGESKLAILRLLGDSPGYGYELWHALSASRRITTASIYQHLGELEALALVRRSGVATFRGRERVVYETTRKGDDFLRLAGRLETPGRSWSRRLNP